MKFIQKKSVGYIVEKTHSEDIFVLKLVYILLTWDMYKSPDVSTDIVQHSCCMRKPAFCI